MAILLGGGGVAYGFANLTVQLFALLVLAFNRRTFFHFWNAAPLLLRVLVLTSLILPLIQLIPLPPVLWEALPGRELITQSFAAVGLKPGWHPISLDPARTLVAGTGIIAPLTLLALGWSLQRGQIQNLGWLLVLLGLLSFGWGAIQVISNGSFGIPYPENPMPGVLFAGFANRNSIGLFLVLCLALALHLDRPSIFGDWSKLLRIGICALFVLGILLTQSRSAMALSLLPLGLFAARIANRRAAIGGLALLVLVTASVWTFPSSRIETALERFDQGDGNRVELWEDAAFSAKRFWPIGSGMGTFDEVFQLDESLENLSPRKAGRAHNDYLEFALEAGLPGLILLGGWLWLIAAAMIRARGSPDRSLAWAGAAMIIALAAQSGVDYPARNQSLLVCSALALLFLMRFSAIEPEQGE
ncbi:MAG: O-antigen ligase domain-containing protein [Sphingomonadales bacterium]|nr:MAG: O-antigen ligase domain-containing protein [Sphingomonadales bacterium]